MKRVLYRVSIITVCATVLCVVLYSCGKDSEDNLFTMVSMQARMPDGSKILRMEVDTNIESSFIRNLNTQMDFDFPLFVNGEATVKLLKGVYLIAFDATATLSNGKSRRVRYAGNNSPQKAAVLVGDNEVIILKLMEL